MKKHVIGMLLLITGTVIPMLANGDMITQMKPIEVVDAVGEVTPLPSSTEVPPGATVTNELAAPPVADETILDMEMDMDTDMDVDMDMPDEDSYSVWVPDIVSEYAEMYGTIILVDITNQHAYACVDGVVIADADCVSGDLYNSPTPTGLYSVWYKNTDFYMMGSYYTAYATFFNGDIALHDADAWRSEYGGSIYQGGGSHGCVNVPRWFAQVVYDNTVIGTAVYVF